uniref:Reverse transcriptase RNase H-like domain-containing protein n=1 Tax=Oryzias latipes TaxID=8090 RepID=A0A3P9LRX1_ORYLA
MKLSEMSSTAKNQISFFGNQYTINGIRPDPAKVRDIQKMPTPQNKNELHRFIGMLSNLSPYIPRFTDKAHTLRGLLKNDAPWVWDTNYQNCFDDLKTIITEDACLKYYDPSVALVQNNQPIAFGFKTLTGTQSRYSNIEREMLAIVYGIQRYHTYLDKQPLCSCWLPSWLPVCPLKPASTGAQVGSLFPFGLPSRSHSNCLFSGPAVLVAHDVLRF